MRIPKIHKCNVWLREYPDIVNGNKPFDLRENDRDYQVGDFLNLIPFDNDRQEELKIGRQLAKVTYVLKDCPDFALQEGYVILGLKFWKDFTEEERLIFRLLEAGKIDPDMKW